MPRDALLEHVSTPPNHDALHAEIATRTGGAVRAIVREADRRTATEIAKDDDTAEILLKHLRRQQHEGWVEGLPSRRMVAQVEVED